MNAIHTRQRSCDSVVFYHDSRTWYKKTNMKNTCDSVLATAWLCTNLCTVVQNFFLVGSRDLGSAPASLRRIKPPFLGLFFTHFCSILAPKPNPSPLRGSARKPIFHARATPVPLAGNMPRFVHRGDGEFEGKRGQAHVSRHGGWYLFVPRPTAFFFWLCRLFGWLFARASHNCLRFFRKGIHTPHHIFLFYFGLRRRGFALTFGGKNNRFTPRT